MEQPGTLVAQSQIVELVAAEVARLGGTRASKALRISRETLARVLAGLPVRPGTLALLREELSRRGAERCA
jgi:hypothetical protein